MVSFREAQKIINSFAGSFGVEYVAIDNALGRVLAEDVFADRDYPPFNRATMDGIAIDFADFEEGWRIFEAIETIFAGQESKNELATGQCYKIMTGAAVPASANAVIRREDIREDGELAIVTAESCKLFQNVAMRGQDLQKERKALEPGNVCTPVTISLLASLGKTEVLVRKLPDVSVVTTGNEVVQVGEPVSPVQIRNSNSHLLKALLLKNGINPVSCTHVQDEKEQLLEVLKLGLNSDILIINGGVSAGDADYVPEILENLGVEKLFHKVAIRPGKPFWCGRIPSGGMVFALPGNPFSCMAVFTLFVEPYINLSQGLPTPTAQFLPLKNPRSRNVSLDEFFPVKIIGNPAMAEALEINGSGDIRLGLNADALALHPVDKEALEPGEMVQCYML